MPRVCVPPSHASMGECGANVVRMCSGWISAWWQLCVVRWPLTPKRTRWYVEFRSLHHGDERANIHHIHATPLPTEVGTRRLHISLSVSTPLLDEPRCSVAHWFAEMCLDDSCIRPCIWTRRACPLSISPPAPPKLCMMTVACSPRRPRRLVSL